jgi:phage baseplate assembly protein W
MADIPSDDIQTSFLGTGWSFPPSFSKGTRTVVMISDLDDIRSSMEILLSTALGERFLQPKFGCSLDRLIFDPLSTTTITYIKGLVGQCLLNFEPRIIVNDVAIATTGEEGRVDIEITFTVRATNSRYNMVYPFYRNEASIS